MFLKALLQLLNVFLECPNCVIGLGPLVFFNELLDQLFDNLVFLPIPVLLCNDETEPLPDVLIDSDGCLNLP